MSNALTKKKETPLATVKSMFDRDDIKAKFNSMLGKKATGFMVTVLNIMTNNDMLKNAEPNSIMFAAATAASLDLPINPNFGFAYIIPYRDNKSGNTYAQFQIGYKGILQLAARSGQYQAIEVKEVYEGQIKEDDSFFGMYFDWKAKESEQVVGYAAYFKLINGFEKILYMTKEEMKKHASKYSQSYGSKKDWVKKSSLWTTDFDTMAKKTVLKLLLSKYGILSVELEKAQLADQSKIKDWDAQEVEYIDNDSEDVEVVEEDQNTPELTDEQKKELFDSEEKEQNVEKFLD